MITKMPKDILSITALRNMLPFEERERKRFPFLSYIRFKLWVLRYIFLLSFRKADKIIFISKYSKSIIENHIPSIGKKSTVIPHGLNSLFLDSKELFDLPNNLKDNQFYLYVSILDVYKAQKEIIKAWKLLINSGFKYPLVLVGPKYNQYGEEVISMIDTLGLKGNIIYLGKVDYEKLPALYKSARVLLFASSCECCPNILLEKLAASKPVICSNIEPMPEFGEDAVLYFDPYKPDTLVKQIRQIEKKPDTMDILAKKAGIQALKFNWNETIENTVKFILNNQKEKNV